MGRGFPPHIPNPRTQNRLFPTHNRHAGDQDHHHNHRYHTHHRLPPHHRMIPRPRHRSPDHQNHIRHIHTHHSCQTPTRPRRPPEHKHHIRHNRAHHCLAPSPPLRTVVRYRRFSPVRIPAPFRHRRQGFN